MNFAILWLDVLLVSVLWVAAATACTARINRRWIRGVLFPLIVGPPLFVLATFAFGATVSKYVARIQPDWFAYALSLLIAFLVGAWLIRRQAAGHEPGFPPAAAGWPRAPLAVAFLVALGIGCMTLLNMDLAIRARCALQSVEISSIYLATLPAITSESQNAAPLYEKAFARLRDDPPGDIHNPPFGTSRDFDPGEPATVAFLARHAATIALLRRAAALPACRFDEDLSTPDMTAMLSVTDRTRLAADCLALQARQEIAHGLTAAAVSDAASILAMGRHFGQRPLLMSALVGFALDNLGNRTLEQALAAVKSPDELSALRPDELVSPGRLFQQALRGEERFGLSVSANMPASRTETVNGNPAVVQDTRLLSSPAGLGGAFFRVFYLNSDAYLNLMENVQNLSTQPYYKIRDQLNAIRDARNTTGILTSILIPSLTKAFESCALAEAGDTCAQTAVAMTRFRLDHGTYPSQLSDLVPAYLDAIPTDPFDGQPIKLTIDANQWIITSAGFTSRPNVRTCSGYEPVILTPNPAPAQPSTYP